LITFSAAPEDPGKEIPSRKIPKVIKIHALFFIFALLFDVWSGIESYIP
jgi:hypothetical protein